METFTPIIETIGKIIDGIGVLVVVLGLVVAVVRFFATMHIAPDPYRQFRQDIGRGILLGLEFLVAADIIRTVAVAPTLGGVLVLGLIVLIRTFLSMALEVELEGRWPWQPKTEPGADEPSSIAKAQLIIPPDQREKPRRPVNSDVRQQNEWEVTMAKITGIGGVFFKSKGDNAALAAWYQRHLGMPLKDFGGAVLKWPDDKAEDQGLTVWHLAAKDSQWFSPSDASFMINYRVDNLDEMLEQLLAGGVEVVKGPESHENGKFAWIMDPEGNKVELWEPMLWDDKNKGA